MAQPADHISVTMRIVQDLGKGIVTGRFGDGRFPTELALAEAYGAARTVTREAVKMLTSKGLIRSRPKIGIRIEPEDHWNLLDPDVLRWLLEREFALGTLIDFTEFRLGVEPNAARLAAMHATPADKHAIVLALRRMEASERKRDDRLAADIGFHVAILEAAHNPFHLQMRDFIATALTYSIRRTNSLKDEVQHRACAEEHDAVARAILDGRPAEAFAAMHDLIERVLVLMHREIAVATAAD